jgi:hypothetical protein
LLLFKISFGFQVKYSVFWALFGGWRTSIIVIELCPFWPVPASVNDDKQILIFASIINGIAHFCTLHVCVCVRLHVTAKVQSKCNQSKMTLT